MISIYIFYVLLIDVESLKLYFVFIQIAAADNDGILQVFSIKKGDMQLHFKTLPGDQISTLRLGGASGTQNKQFAI